MAILVERVTVVYHPGSPGEHLAVQDVSLFAADGACVAIVGMTGSGKSTLAQTLNGLIAPTSGRVVVDDLELTARGLRGRDLRELRRRVGLLFQSPEGQLFAPSIGEDVMFGPLQLKTKPREARERASWALSAVGLPSDDAFLARSPFALSGGQRRRVALAGVLAMRPHTLVLDEPSAGLDAEGREEMYATLRALREQERLTLILISHDMSEVAALAEQVYVLRDGRLRMSGTPDAVFARAEELADCGLLAPPLAQVAALARSRGLLTDAPAALTPATLGAALASAGIQPALSQVGHGESRALPLGGDERHAR
ncbi:MAG TPA: ATP-binding cassette domain-containing protein [Ktedonobacterales bacterium]